jgi:uncharacterized membrane protein
MTIDHFVSRLWRGISLLGIVAALFLSYVNLPDPVAVQFDPFGTPETTLSKSSVFYVTAGTLLGVNVLFLLLARVITSLPGTRTVLPAPAKWAVNPVQLHAAWADWLYLGIAVINTFLCFALYALTMINLPEVGKSVFEYRWMLGLGVFLGTMWLAYLPLRLLLGRPKAEEL